VWHDCSVKWKSKMRVAFDGRSLSSPVLRGWDRYTVGLVGELVRQGIEVTLFHRACEPLHQAHVANLGCRVMGLPDRGGLYWEQVAVPLALWRGRYDLFHAPAEHGVPLAAPCPVVLTYHSVTLHSYADLVRRGLLPGRVRDYLGYDGRPSRRTPAATYMNAQVARADHIVVPSEFCREEVIRFLRVAPRRVSVTPLAVHEQFRKPVSAPEARAAVLARLGIRRPYLLYVGGYEPHKNVPGLLAAFAAVKAACPDLSLVLVGSKALPEALPAQAVILGLKRDGDVRFLLNLTNDLTDVYDGAELFVSLSWRETFCLPALEALTRGVPVVASAWGATSEVLGHAGVLVDPRETSQATDAILKSLSSKGERRPPAIVNSIARRFAWTTTADQTVAIYSRLLGGRKKRVG
jgi:glycosyltransferase involved in cell wall biosynthesis